MSSEALRAPNVANATLSHIAFKSARTLAAIGIAGAAIYAPLNGATIALDRFTGTQLAQGRLATTLGSETFSAAGSPSGAVGWLGAVVAEAFVRGGTALSTFVAVLVSLLTFALVERRARRMAGPVFGLAAAMLAALCSIGSFGFAGGVVTAAFTIALAEILDRSGRKSAAFATLLAVVWCNVSAAGLIAPALALVFALGARFEARSEEEQRQRWIAFAGTALAVLATPGFLAYPAIALEELRLDRALEGIVQFDPSDVAPVAYRNGFFLAMFAAFAIGMPQKRLGDVLLFFSVVLLALANGAFLGVFGVLVAPILAASAAASFPLPERKLASARGDVMVAIASILAAAVLVTTVVPRERPAEPAFGLVATLAADSKPHRLFCSNVEWCDAALASGSQTRVFMDSRVGAYPQSIRDAQLDVFHMRAPWRKTLANARIDALLARKDRQLSMLISLTPGWKAVASDDLAVLYERESGAK